MPALLAEWEFNWHFTLTRRATVARLARLGQWEILGLMYLPPAPPLWFADAWQRCQCRTASANRVQVNPSSRSRPFSMRDPWILIQVLSGAMELRHPERACSLHAGQAVLLPPLLGFLQLPATQPLEYQMVNFLVAGLAPGENPLTRLDLPLVFDLPCTERIQWCWDGVLASCTQQGCPPGPRRQIWADAFLNLLLVHCLWRLTERVPPSQTGLQPAWLDRTIHRLKKSKAADGLTLASIARDLGRSTRCVNAAFTAAMGLSLPAWLRRRRLDQVQTMLRSEADQSISEIARRCGYRDAAELSRAFRKAFGCPPQRWRRAIPASEPAVDAGS
jgi:AraC-like DNA-binding protein